jgi:hypothetical protein
VGLVGMVLRGIDNGQVGGAIWRHGGGQWQV